MITVKGFISVTHISSGFPVSITKVSTIDNEQEKEKLKGKGVVIAGSLENPKKEEIDNQENNNAQSNTIEVNEN